MKCITASSLMVITFSLILNAIHSTPRHSVWHLVRNLQQNSVMHSPIFRQTLLMIINQTYGNLLYTLCCSEWDLLLTVSLPSTHVPNREGNTQPTQVQVLLGPPEPLVCSWILSLHFPSTLPLDTARLLRPHHRQQLWESLKLFCIHPPLQTKHKHVDSQQFGGFWLPLIQS